MQSELWRVPGCQAIYPALLIISLWLYGCAPEKPTAIVVVVNPTDFVATRAAEELTRSAATFAAQPTATPQSTVVTETPGPTATPTLALTPSLTPTASPSPFPTLPLDRFPHPPANFSGEPHLFFARPIGEGGNVFIASNYRYGSTLNNQLETHHGVEFANPLGVNVVAVGPGVVYYAGGDSERQFGPQTSFYGNLVVLQLTQAGRPVYALYGHLDHVLVSAEQAVNAGEVLGVVGSTGVAYGPHLHFEVRLDNPDNYWATRNPELWLAPASGAGAVAVRVTNERDQYLPGMRLNVLCTDGAKRFLDTYWDPGVTPDDLYGENAALTDVPAGYCKFETDYQGQTLVEEVTVQAGTINFVWLKP